MDRVQIPSKWDNSHKHLSFNPSLPVQALAATHHNPSVHRALCHQYHRMACPISHNSNSNHSRCKYLRLPSPCNPNKPQQTHSDNRCCPAARLLPARSIAHRRIRSQSTTPDFHSSRNRLSILRPTPCHPFRNHRLLLCSNSNRSQCNLYSLHPLAQTHSHGNHHHKAPYPHRVDSLSMQRAALILSVKVPLSTSKQVKAGRMLATKGPLVE